MGDRHMILLLLAIAVQGQAVAEEPPIDDIVVVARKQKCQVRFADRDMSDGDFKRRSAEWAAGKPVRVIARESTDIKCLAKIAFKLADRGVTRIEFVEPDRPATVSAPPYPSSDFLSVAANPK